MCTLTHKWVHSQYHIYTCTYMYTCGSNVGGGSIQNVEVGTLITHSYIICTILKPTIKHSSVYYTPNGHQRDV